MKELLMLLILVGTQSCPIRGSINSEGCKSYYEFLKKNWSENDNSTYSFKGDPSYWNNDVYVNYIKDGCLVGLERKVIEKIFGSPTKHFKSQKLNVIIYCMSDICLKNEFIYGGRLLRFDFDNNGKVKEVFTSPGASDISD